MRGNFITSQFKIKKMENIKKAIVKSNKGIEYNVSISKAKELIDKCKCEWVGGEKIEEYNKKTVETLKEIEIEGEKTVKRGRKPKTE